jgi:hypothetical protein
MSELRTHPADLNLSPEVVGRFQRFLFVRYRRARLMAHSLTR